MKQYAFLLSMFIFEIEGGDVLLVAAIDDVDFVSTESFGGVGGVDGGVACADDYDLAAYRASAASLVAGDKFNRVDDSWVVVAGDVELAHRAKSDAEEDDVEFPLQLLQIGPIGDVSLFEFDSERADQLDFAQTVGGAELVFGDSVGVEPAGQRFPIKDCYLKSSLL